MSARRPLALACTGLAALAVAACGSSSSKSTASGGGQSASSSQALSADANSAATGDIPDNQVFLVFHDPRAGFSIKYPEGWTQSSGPDGVTFRDKNNLVRVRIARGPEPTPALATQQLNRLKATEPSLAVSSAKTVSIGGRSAVRAVYTTESAANAVTGRKVVLVVDRYELTQAGKLAIVDLGTPRGVDNVDAYRMMIESFRWR